MKSKQIDKDIKLTIVIVDDEQNEHVSIKHALADFKNILFNDYYNGEDFLKFLEHKSTLSHSKKHYPDIVILDVHMAKLSGFELFEMIEKKGLKKHMQFYIFTNSTDEENHNCEKFQLTCYQKPFNIINFTRLLEIMIEDYAQLDTNKNRP